MIAIIDYGMGNLRSVQKAFEKVGLDARVITSADEVESAGGVVLPGVGAFADAMSNLKKTGLDLAVHRAVGENKPFLGICLGLQMLFETSDEWGSTPGLGILKGTVRRLPDRLKVPHMGWNHVKIAKPCPIFKDIPDCTAFYFVHSYYVDPGETEVVAGTTDYGMDFTCAVARGNIFAIQFHPEKSSGLGLKILQNFGEVVESC